MVGKERVTELSLRKQALIVESELNRLALRTEVSHLRAAKAVLGDLVIAGGWLWLLAPVAGFWMMRVFRRRESAPSRATSIWTALQSLYSLWTSFGGKRKAPVA